LRHTAVYVGEQEKEEDVYTGEFDVLTSPTKEKKNAKKTQNTKKIKERKRFSNQKNRTKIVLLLIDTLRLKTANPNQRSFYLYNFQDATSFSCR